MVFTETPIAVQTKVRRKICQNAGSAASFRKLPSPIKAVSRPMASVAENAESSVAPTG